ncbi:MAG: gamma carbonic anhydrase family protein [Oscillospiraceae bacterium]|nr:gamma carbonic anhydrase family protein [Oscillospiraceae bacterium]
MIVKPCLGKTPVLHPCVRLAENAVVTGDVTVGADTSIWYGAVLRGDAGPIVIGRECSIQDNVTFHEDPRLGDGVVVGHNAVIHGCIVEDHCTVGMGAVVLDGAVIGRGSVIGAGCVVTKGTVVPPASLVLGVPGKVVRTGLTGQEAEILQSAQQYVQLARQELEAWGER